LKLKPPVPVGFIYWQFKASRAEFFIGICVLHVSKYLPCLLG